ncbi:MAG TPA: glycine cleavage system aminomethyltransferase GcvT [Vicinamibacteria bacterium]|nr:glycine cleavage system aminomethyltransferase GcvT [Vicinamibacteria bacterium]
MVLPRRTPLYSLHRELGARIVDFAGWEMPVDYGGVVAEHMSVREEAGLFDVSHMGEFFVEGSDAEAFLQRLTPNDVSRLAIGQAQYSALTTERGTFVDDILVYRLDERRYLLVVNAANIEKDFSWIESRKTGDVSLRDESDRYALLALQGPRAAALLEPLTDVDLGSMKYYRFARGKVLDEESLVSRTGYTGEDGFEIMLEASGAERVARGLLGRGVAPVGLAARDTLRLEAKMALYGNDIDEEHTVLEADLGWIIKWQKGDFTGREALERQKERGVTRRLVGFEMIDRGIARHGHRVFVGGKSAETVTSGSFAPYLKKNIGLTYLPVESCEEGTEIEIDIRGRRAGARVAPTPFYKRGMKSA